MNKANCNIKLEERKLKFKTWNNGMVEHVTSHEFFEYFEAMFIMFSSVEYFVVLNKSWQDYLYTRNIYMYLYNTLLNSDRVIG